jgi:hypothetical protein
MSPENRAARLWAIDLASEATAARAPDNRIVAIRNGAGL